MEILTADEQKAIYELQYVLDLSGFRHNIAYDVIGIQSPAVFSMKRSPGTRQLHYEAIVAMTECIKEELATGKYPSCIDREHEQEQLQKLFDAWRERHAI